MDAPCARAPCACATNLASGPHLLQVLILAERLSRATQYFDRLRAARFKQLMDSAPKPPLVSVTSAHRWHVGCMGRDVALRSCMAAQ